MMPSRRSRSTIIVFLLALVIAGGGMSYVRAATPFDGTPSARATNTATPADVREVFEINTQIQQKQQRLEELRASINRYRQSISDAQSKSRTLRSQLAVLEDRIARQVLALEAAATERERVALEATATQLDLETLRTTIDRQRALLRGLLQRLAITEQSSAVQVLLADVSLGAFLAYRDRIAIVQHDLRTTMTALREDRESLEARERDLAARQDELRALTERLNDEREILREEQEGKARLFAVTQQNEAKYQQLLANLRSEQEQINTDIVTLDAQVRERLAAIDQEFGKTGRVAFSWPVPNHGITTYFHDPEYPFRNVYEHPGLDIRAAQGSPIAAPAPGYVARTKDAGYGYSYIMLIHPGGYATVYGHVSQISVREDTYVTRGQVIGLTGGKPGTRGAGRLTTGSHLHFEIRVNGIPVNPLNYLL